MIMIDAQSHRIQRTFDMEDGGKRRETNICDLSSTLSSMKPGTKERKPAFEKPKNSRTGTRRPDHFLSWVVEQTSKQEMKMDASYHCRNRTQ